MAPFSSQSEQFENWAKFFPLVQILIRYDMPHHLYGLPCHFNGLLSQLYGFPDQLYGLPRQLYGLPRQLYGLPHQHQVNMPRHPDIILYTATSWWCHPSYFHVSHHVNIHTTTWLYHVSMLTLALYGLCQIHMFTEKFRWTYLCHPYSIWQTIYAIAKLLPNSLTWW